MGEPVWWIGEGDWDLAEFHAATLEWVRSLGLNPEWLKPCAEVVERDGQYEFRADEIVRDADGKPSWDPANPDELFSVPRAVPVEKDSWPPRPVEVPA